MKERPASEVEAGCGAASAALRCVGLRSATAALRSNCSSVSGAKGLQKSIGKSAAEWHFTLGERYTLARRTFPPREATQMSHEVKYIGMDVHKEAIVIAVLNGSGKLVMETVVETKASSILEFIHGLRGELHVTWEEGTWAAWLYDVLQPQVQHIVVCNPRRNALLKEGSKSDKVDARELGRSYQTLSQDLTRVMNRLKALYRGWGIPCAGTQVYAPRYREEWLSKIVQAGVRRRAELLYQQLDGLQVLRREVRGEFLAESRKQKAAKLLRQIPCIGPIRAGLLIALMQTPHRFRSKRQLGPYSGLGIETHDSAQYRYVGGQLQRSKKPQQIRGLNHNHNHR